MKPLISDFPPFPIPGEREGATPIMYVAMGQMWRGGVRERERDMFQTGASEACYDDCPLKVTDLKLVH